MTCAEQRTVVAAAVVLAAVVLAVVVVAVVGVAAIMARLVVVGIIIEGAAYVDVKHIFGKSRRVFYVFLKAPIANHSDPNPLK